MQVSRKRRFILFILPALILMAVFISWSAFAQNESAKAPSQAAPIPRLVALGRHQCTPCKMMAPVLDELKREYAGILNVEFIDIREHPEAVRKYGIRGIPFQILYDASGKELKRHYGYMSKDEILNMLRELGVDLSNHPIEKKK